MGPSNLNREFQNSTINGGNFASFLISTSSFLLLQLTLYLTQCYRFALERYAKYKIIRGVKPQTFNVIVNFMQIYLKSVQQMDKVISLFGTDQSNQKLIAIPHPKT